MKQNFFRLLELPERYDLDLAALDKQYRLLSQRLHPDRQERSTDAAHRTRLLAEAALLNEAYQTLKHPDKRALHLLACLMGPGVETSHTPPADPVFLAEMLEWQEAISEIAPATMQQRVTSAIIEQHDHIQNAFSRVTLDPDKETRTILGALVKLRYYRRMLDTLHRLEEEP